MVGVHCRNNGTQTSIHRYKVDEHTIKNVPSGTTLNYLSHSVIKNFTIATEELTVPSS